MSSLTETPTPAPTRRIVLPSARVLVGGVYALCVLLPVLIFVGVILFTDQDPHAPEGAIASIVSIGGAGTAALAIGLALALGLARPPQRAAVGTIVLGVLSVVSLVIFWCGAPGLLGACAAWRAGLTRGGEPLGGAARTAGLVGAFVAALNVVLTIGGFILAWLR